MAIPFVERKRPCYERVTSVLSRSEVTGSWSNFGPVSLQLEAAVAERLELPANRRVVACANGTMALHALVQLYQHLRGRPLRWVVSAFTFYSQRQGPLADAIVVDCDANGLLDLGALRALDPDTYDGIVVTHLFGTARSIAPYQEHAARSGKVLLFDSATCFGTTYRGRFLGCFGDGEIFSFHHTKPCGFGEGGCAVVPADFEDTFRSLLNFGLYKAIDTGGRSTNGKMADVAAAFILDRLEGFDTLRQAHRHHFQRVAAVAQGLGYELLVDGSDESAFPSLVPVLFPHPVGADRCAGGPVVIHKYYRPLSRLPNAEGLHSRIVCLPCHPEMAALSDEEIGSILESLAD